MIIVIMAGLLIFVSLGYGIYLGFSFFMDKLHGNPGDTPVNVDPTPVDTAQGIKVSLVDYQVYTGDSENIGFNFVIAELRFESEGPVSFDLGNLQTSEKIYLNNVSKYLNTLEEKSYKVSKLGIVNTVVSDKNDYTCKVFVPYKTDSYSLRLLNSVDASMIEFDLGKNINDVSILKFETPQQIEVGNTNVSVSSSFVSTMMLHNDMEYQVPATMNVYTFRINVNSVEGDVMITDARFVRASSDEVVSCMDETYESVSITNCLGKKLQVGDNGALFFETFAGKDGPDYEGFLMLMFSNGNDWVKIPTVLE